jgi:hypothetical protein
MGENKSNDHKWFTGDGENVIRHYIDGRLLEVQWAKLADGGRCQVSIGHSNFNGQAWIFEKVKEEELAPIELNFMSPRQKKNNFFFYEDEVKQMPKKIRVPTQEAKI